MKLNNNDDSHNSGLNLLIYNMLLDIESHPAWVCGLKQLFPTVFSGTKSHTLRGCVDWNWCKKPQESRHLCHTLRGCVDWNSLWTMISLTCVASHPAWVCGLKLINIHITMSVHLSHPAWVCGLKLINIHITMSVHLSHPAWVCGLKLHRIGNPYLFLLSHPAWVCGLKHVQRDSRK